MSSESGNYQMGDQSGQSIGTLMPGRGRGPCASPPGRSVKSVGMGKRLAIEFLATYFVLLVHGVVAAVSSDLLTIALTQGLTLAVILATFYHSGPHINGMVTLLALFLGKELKPRVKLPAAIGYLLAQAIASVLAALTAWCLLPSSSTLGVPALVSGYSVGQGWLAEFLASTMVLSVILVVNINYNQEGRLSLRFNNPALIVGLAVFAGVMFAGSMTGAAINPWRHFGGAFFVSGYSNSYWWIYWIGPLSSAIVTWLVYILFLRERS